MQLAEPADCCQSPTTSSVLRWRRHRRQSLSRRDGSDSAPQPASVAKSTSPAPDAPAAQPAATTTTASSASEGSASGGVRSDASSGEQQQQQLLMQQKQRRNSQLTQATLLKHALRSAAVRPSSPPSAASAATPATGLSSALRARLRATVDAALTGTNATPLQRKAYLAQLVCEFEELNGRVGSWLHDLAIDDTLSPLHDQQLPMPRCVPEECT